MKRLVFNITISLSLFSCHPKEEVKMMNIESYDDGGIARKYETMNGLKSGFDSIFYKNGNLKSYHQWKNDTLIFEGFEFYNEIVPMVVTQNSDTFIQNVSKINSYYFYNKQGLVSFTVGYNSLLNPSSIDGDGIASIFINTDYNTASLFVAEPPILESKVIITDMSNIIGPDTLYPKNNLITINFDKYRNADLKIYFESQNDLYHHLDSLLITSERASIKRY